MRHGHEAGVKPPPAPGHHHPPPPSPIPPPLAHHDIPTYYSVAMGWCAVKCLELSVAGAGQHAVCRLIRSFRLLFCTSNDLAFPLVKFFEAHPHPFYFYFLLPEASTSPPGDDSTTSQPGADCELGRLKLGCVLNDLEVKFR
jgi:hypothetical protein